MNMDLIRITLFLFHLNCVSAHSEYEKISNRILQIENRFRALKQDIIDLKSNVDNADHGLDECKKSVKNSFSDLTVEFEDNFQLLKDKFNKHYAKRDRKRLNEMINEQADSIRSLVEVENEDETWQLFDETAENVSDTFNYGIVFKASVITKTIFGEGEETLIFSNSHYNIGQGYDPNTGTFTAPSKGTYIFTTQLYVKYHYRIDIGIAVNSDYIALASLAPGNNACYNAKVIANIEKGDLVRVKHISSAGTRGLDQFTNSNSFSGVMIR